MNCPTSTADARNPEKVRTATCVDAVNGAPQTSNDRDGPRTAPNEEPGDRRAAIGRGPAEGATACYCWTGRESYSNL
jgi:hypothetical protein